MPLNNVAHPASDQPDETLDGAVTEYDNAPGPYVVEEPDAAQPDGQVQMVPPGGHEFEEP